MNSQFLLYLDAISKLIIILGFPLAFIQYMRTKHKEKQDREYGTYNSLDEKYLEFQKADIFVFPSFNDAFPLVILEAMQFSLPVISTFEGSIPDIIIDNVTGFLVETHNAYRLAERIAILLKDKDLRIEMGKKGYERFINNFTLSHFENNMNKTFQSILELNG